MNLFQPDPDARGSAGTLRQEHLAAFVAFVTG